MSHHGYDVMSAEYGAAALAGLRDGMRRCVVLLALAMPDMDGFAFRRAQLADPELASIPVIVVSGGGWANAADARQLGMTTFLRKPMVLERFVIEVDNLCRPR